MALWEPSHELKARRWLRPPIFLSSSLWHLFPSLLLDVMSCFTCWLRRVGLFLRPPCGLLHNHVLIGQRASLHLLPGTQGRPTPVSAHTQGLYNVPGSPFPRAPGSLVIGPFGDRITYTSFFWGTWPLGNSQLRSGTRTKE